MLGNGEAQDRIIRPEFNRSILMDFLGAKITTDAGFLALREIDERFKVTIPMWREVDDPRSPVHLRHSMVEMIRQWMACSWIDRVVDGELCSILAM